VEDKVVLVADPRSEHAAEDRALQQKTAMTIYKDLERLTYIAAAAAGAREQAKANAGKLGKNDALVAKLSKLADTLEDLSRSLAASSDAGWLSGEEKLREKMGQLYGAVNQFEGKPTDSQLKRLAILEKELEQAALTFQSFVAKEVAAVNPQLVKQKLDPITVPSQEEWLKKQETGSAAGAGGIPLTWQAAAEFQRGIGRILSLW